MNEFNRCNKVTGVHWLKKPVESIKIRVKLKPQDGILSLPKYEDYTDESKNLTLHELEKVDEHIFNWQEKIFSSWELQRYSDVHNCISDTELTYHEKIKNEDYEPSKIFTYIHEDYHLPLPSDAECLREIKSNKFSVPNLNSCLERLNLEDKVSRLFGKESSSTGNLFRSEENIAMEESQWSAMHVVFDNSEYNEDSQLLLKQEVLLVSLYHNTSQNYLIMSPNVNSLELNPYTAETVAGAAWGYQYAVDIGFGEEEGGDELDTLLRKLHLKWEKRHKQLVPFAMPPLGTKLCCVRLEILTAADFEEDVLYVEYDVKIPEGVKCSGPVHGRTHTTKVLRDEDTEEWHFAHIVELNLEMAAGTDPPPLQLFFEVISLDWWGTHRTEGYTYLPLTLAPGYYSKQLSCSRPEELDEVAAESRRFFIGGCNLIKDLEILATPQLQDANFKYTTTGFLNIRWSLISQVPKLGLDPQPTGLGTASALLLGAEAALRHYKRARARLAAATEGLASCDGGGDR